MINYIIVVLRNAPDEQQTIIAENAEYSADFSVFDIYIDS